MEKIVFAVPKMYADHHVDSVRAALLSLDGVEEVIASSAFQQVLVTYNPARVTPSAIEQALRVAGYGPGEHWPLPVIPEGKEDASSWFRTIPRVSETNMRDREMSGDFRKY